MIQLFILSLSLHFILVSCNDCTVGPRIYDDPLSNVGSYLSIYTDFSFPCSGKILRWQFYARSVGHPVYLGAWMRVNATGWKLIGANKVVAKELGPQSFEVDPENYITVTTGLVLGVHYPKARTPQDELVIPYADSGRPYPYRYSDLSGGFPLQLGEEELKNTGGRINQDLLTKENWRVPAVQAVVKDLPDCGHPPEIPFGLSNYRGTVQYSTAAYRCKSGFRMEGNPLVSCLTTGKWTAPPTCDVQELCGAGPFIEDSPLTQRSPVVQIFTDMRIGCTGFVGRWRYYAEVAGQPVYFSVWKPRSGTTYELIGYHKVVAEAKGLQYYRVPKEQAFVVYPNFVVGMHYDSDKLPSNRVVVPYATENSLGPYETTDLYRTLLMPIGHTAILAANGMLNFSANHAATYKRVPALRVYIMTARLCDDPIAPEHGFVQYNGTTPGSRALYSCDNGYTVLGQNPALCRDNLTWSFEPICSALNTCSDPPDISNGVVYYNSTRVSSVALYTCAAGFTIVGTNPIKCGPDLLWGKEPYCQASGRCGEPEKVKDGRFSYVSSEAGSVAIYSCNPGYEMIGNGLVRCLSSLAWEGTKPSCQAAGFTRKTDIWSTVGDLTQHIFTGLITSSAARPGGLLPVTDSPGFNQITRATRPISQTRRTSAPFTRPRRTTRRPANTGKEGNSQAVAAGDISTWQRIEPLLPAIITPIVIALLISICGIVYVCIRRSARDQDSNDYYTTTKGSSQPNDKRSLYESQTHSGTPSDRVDPRDRTGDIYHDNVTLSGRIHAGAPTKYYASSYGYPRNPPPYSSRPYTPAWSTGKRSLEGLKGPQNGYI